MNESDFMLTVKDSKAISEAKIRIDQITVLTGVNASGKSTLARIWHQLVYLSAAYIVLAERNAWEGLSNWATQIVRLKDRLVAKSGADSFLASPEKNVTDFSARIGFEPLDKVVKDLDAYTKEVSSILKKRISDGETRRALVTFLRAVGVGEEFSDNIDGIGEIYTAKAGKCLLKFGEIMSKREYYVYNQAKYFKLDTSWLTDAGEIELREGGEIVYAAEAQEASEGLPSRILVPKAPLKEIFGLKDALYIASPWVSIPRINARGTLQMSLDDSPHMVVNSATVKNPADNGNSIFSILDGAVEIDEASGSRRWVYKRSDGLVVGLGDCATGIKSLAILDILFTRGYLNSETLLIIDEPEAHLHPQWIVEYARILVAISKRLNVRMLLTSHSPDMVAALQKIGNADKLDGMRFYLAEPDKGADKYKYRYRDLGKDIEPIFDMFNIAIERIDSYGNP